MDNFRDSYFPVQWDLSKKRINCSVWGKQYDTGRGLSITVISGGQVVSPTTEIVRLKWEKPDHTDGYVDSAIIGGKFIIEKIDQFFTVAGSVRADLEMWVGGEVISSVTFYASVEKAVAVDAIESSSDFTALQEAMSGADGVRTILESARMKSVLLGQNDMTEEFVQQMAGTTPVNATPAKGSLTTDRFAKNAITPMNTSFIELGKNMFNKADVTIGYKVGTNGTLTADATFSVSGYIPALPSTQYYRKQNFYGTVYYDANFAVIGNVFYAAGTFTTPANTSYVRINLPTDQLNNEQMELGTAATVYETYGVGIKGIKNKSVPYSAIADNAKFDSYPFQPLATFNNETVFAEMKKAIKRIEIYGADPTKKYCMGLIMRKATTYGTRIYIYECNADGTTKAYVGLTVKTNYVEPTGIDEFTVNEANASGIYAKVWIDWSKITDGANYDFTHYDKSGIDYRAYAPLTTDGFRIVLPPKIYGIVGKEVNIYFDNISLSTNINNYQFDVVSTIGTQQNERWTFVPTVAGTTALTINAYKDGVLVGTATTSIIVKASTVGNGVNRRLLFIGDSTTEAGVYTQELLNLQTADTMKLNLIGTLGTAPNSHEGRGGWSINQYYTSALSPFVFTGAFNFSQYITNNAYANIDYINIHLGINDTFAQTDDVTLNANIATAITELNAMIASIRTYSATVKIGLLIAIPPSYNQDAFGKNYGSVQTRWRYKRNNFLWVKAFIDTYKNREAENIHLVPVNTNIDTVNNMSTETVAVNSRNSKQVVRQSNGVHPAAEGYYQMADAIWYWLKSFEV